MSNDRKEDVKILTELNIDAIRAALNNADNLFEAQVAVPAVNPRDLRLDDQIFGVHLNPITYKPGTKIPKEPNTVKYPSINAININSLQKGVKEDCITVNGSIDIPIATGRTVTLDQVYVSSEAHARTLAIAVMEVQLEKINELEIRIADEKEFLLKQVKDNRY